MHVVVCVRAHVCVHLWVGAFGYAQDAHARPTTHMMRLWKFWYGLPLPVMTECIVSPAGLLPLSPAVLAMTLLLPSPAPAPAWWGWGPDGLEGVKAAGLQR